jgi:stage II sporulation protein E
VIAGCCPAIPLYFLVMWMAQLRRDLLYVCMSAAIVWELSLVDAVKYLAVIYVSGVILKMAELIFGRMRPVATCAIHATVLVLISLAGDNLWSNAARSYLISILEGVFVLSAAMVLHPLMGRFLYEREKTGGEYTVGQSRIQNYAQSFQELSRSFMEMETMRSVFSPEEIGRMQQEVVSCVCSDCASLEYCTNRRENTVYQMLYRMFHNMEYRREDAAHPQTGLEECCEKPNELAKEATRVFERAKLNIAWYNRLLENREIIAEQLGAMADVMEMCAKDSVDVTAQESGRAADVRRTFAEYGLSISHPVIIRRANGKYALSGMVSSVSAAGVPLKQCVKAATKGMGTAMIYPDESQKMITREEEELIFEEEPDYHMLYGVARATKDGEGISGDNFTILMPRIGQMVMALSDGMGSGRMADDESAAVMEMLEKFLEAGFTQESALRMMSASMLLQEDRERFSTVDMISTDLYSGRAELYKIGAAPTFLLRDHKVTVLSGCGVDEKIPGRMELARDGVRLKDGDYLIMVSDGVLDHLPVASAEQYLSEKLSRMDSVQPTKMARGILDAAIEKTGGRIPDDMTVLVSGIWE